MPVPKPAALAMSTCAVVSAITSCSGSLATSTTADAGPDVDAAATVGAPPSSALRQVSLTTTHVNFGDSPTADAWKQIGFNLDGKVTTATSTNVCQLVQGAASAAQDDGQNGVDNSFGENICPILATLDMGGSCSSLIPETYVDTDALGSGTLTIHLLSTYWWKIPITDAHVVLNGDGSGMLGAVAPAVAMIEAFVGALSLAHCDVGQSPVTIESEFEQASDILLDGSNHTGPQCDAISIGMQFWDATPFDGVLPFPDACPTD